MPKPSSRQTITAVIVQRAQRGWPSQSCASPPRPTARSSLVDEAVELQQLPEDDADHRDREHVGQEQRPAVEAPATQPFEEQDREQERRRDEDRHREQQPGVVAERGAEGRIAPGDAEVLGRPGAVEAQ